MKKYRKKPLEIYAVKWDGINVEPIDDLIRMGTINNAYHLGHAPGDGALFELEIHTLEGNMIASPGDYIIRGIRHELYPCKPDVFEASYDEVKEQTYVDVPDQDGNMTRVWTND